MGTKQVLNSLPEPVTLAHKDLVLTVFGPAHPLPTPVGRAPHGIWDVIGWNVVWDSDFFSTDYLFVYSVFDVFSNQLPTCRNYQRALDLMRRATAMPSVKTDFYDEVRDFVSLCSSRKVGSMIGSVEGSIIHCPPTPPLSQH